MAAQETNTQEPEKSDEQLKALKRQVSGIPDSLYTAAPAKPETDEAKAEQLKAEQAKTAEPKK